MTPNTKVPREKSGRKQADMTERTEKGQFAKGHSGNKSGKPTGARNKATLATLELLEGETEALSRKALDMALNGDTAALRLCLERLAPQSKERPLDGFELPTIRDSKSALDALNIVAQRLAGGELLPSEAAAICKLLEQYRRHFETTILAERIEALEAKIEITKQN